MKFKVIYVFRQIVSQNIVLYNCPFREIARNLSGEITRFFSIPFEYDALGRPNIPWVSILEYPGSGHRHRAQNREDEAASLMELQQDLCHPFLMEHLQLQEAPETSKPRKIRLSECNIVASSYDVLSRKVGRYCVGRAAVLRLV